MPHVDKFYEYKPLPWYPHMGPKDASLWNWFVIRNPGRFERVVYDMRCGTVEDCDASLPKNIQDAWNDLCRGRIDVVAETASEIFVIEVKPRARGEALGQALNNRHLYLVENPTTKPTHAAVITDVLIPGTRDAAAALGVALWTP